MIRIDEYGRGYTQLPQIAEQFKVKDTRDIHVMKIPDHYKQKILAEGLWVKLYNYDRKNNIYHLPPSAGKLREDRISIIKNEIEFSMKAEELYPEQRKVLCGIRDDNNRTAFIESDTGTGKSYMLSWLIALRRTKTLIVVPNISIARGLMEKISKWSDKVFIAQGKNIVGAEQEYDIIICHHTTFNMNYEYLNGKYNTLIIDEWHHLPRKRIDQLCLWKWYYVYWLSATPIRKEFGREWVEKIFGKIYETWLSTLPVKVLVHKFRYDYDDDELANASVGLPPDSNEIFRRLVVNNNKRYQELVDIIERLNMLWYTKYIVFSDRVKHIEKIIDILRNAWHNVVWYYGKTNKNESDEFIAKHDKYIIVWHPTSCGEWFDVPELEVSILFTSTWWEWAVKQMAWRSKRISGEKKEAILVDFVDQLSIMGSKTKNLSFGKRLKVYKQLDWETTAL